MPARAHTACLSSAFSLSSPVEEVRPLSQQGSRLVRSSLHTASSVTTDIPLAAALNYPLSRGTATAFPLSAFGLSAFLFSTIGSFALRDDTSKLLLLLASGTVLLPVISFPFLRVYPQQHYHPLSTEEPNQGPNSQALHRTSSADSRRRHPPESIGAQSTSSIPSHNGSVEDVKDQSEDGKPPEDSESSSLISKSYPDGLGDHPFPKSADLPDIDHDGRHTDLRGLALLPRAEFWQLFLLMGLMTGIGLMTIKYVVKSL